MSKITPSPEGSATVTPHLVVKDGRKAIDFYKQAFGAEERCAFPGPDGKFMHGEIKIGSSILMLAAENPQMNAKTAKTNMPATMT